MSFNKILTKYRKISFPEKDKGERFERLMKSYLLIRIQINVSHMKKYWGFITCFLMLFSSSLFSQNSVLVPFRVGNLFGLSDLSGKIVLAAKYTNIEPIGNNAFKFELLNDSQKSLGSNPKMASKTGVLIGTKEVVKNSEHSTFSYLDEGLIIGSENSYSSVNSNLYNLKGEKLLLENVSNFKVISHPNKNSKLTNLAVIVLHKDERVSIYNYNAKAQKLNPIIDKVTNFKLKNEELDQEYLICSYLDQNQSYFTDKIYFDAKAGQFIRKPYTKSASREGNASEDEEGYGQGESGSGEMLVDDAGIDMGESIPMRDAEAGDVSNVTDATPKYFELSQDQTLTFNGKPVNLTSNEKYYFATSYNTNIQKEAMLFYDGKQYGLFLSENTRSEQMYDTLIYILNQYTDYDAPDMINFLAGKRDAKGNWKYGILKYNGKVLVPLQYDEIRFSFTQLKYEYYHFDGQGKMVFKEQNIYKVDANFSLKAYSRGSFIVMKGAKFGILNAKNEILLPVVYDKIWQNEINYISNYPHLTNLYVYQLGDKYGCFYLNGSRPIEKNTKAIFPKIPLFLHENYMNQLGLNIYYLADETASKFCYASNKGIIYYKAK